MVRAWLDVEIISAISFRGFSVLPVPWKKRDAGYEVGPTKVTVKWATKRATCFTTLLLAKFTPVLQQIRFLQVAKICCRK